MRCHSETTLANKVIIRWEEKESKRNQMNYKDFSYTSERKTNNITKLTTQLATWLNLVGVDFIMTIITILEI